MGCSFATCFSFCITKANEQIVKQTGIDALGNLHEAQYSAAQVGVHVNDPVYQAGHWIDDKLHGLGASPDTTQGPVSQNTSPEKLCSTVDELIKLRDRIAKTPHGAAVCFMHALLNWSNPATRLAGKQMLILAVAEESLIAGNTYKTYSLNEDIEECLTSYEDTANYVVPSYAVGAAPNNSYTFDSNKLIFSYDPSSEDKDTAPEDPYTIYLWSSGAPDSPRSIVVKKNIKGIYKVTEFSQLLGDVQQPWCSPTAADDL